MWCSTLFLLTHYITQHVLIPTPHVPLHYLNRSSAMNICPSTSKKNPKNIYHNFIHQSCSGYKVVCWLRNWLMILKKKGDSVLKIVASFLADLDLILSLKRRSCVHGFSQRERMKRLCHIFRILTLYVNILPALVTAPSAKYDVCSTGWRRAGFLSKVIYSSDTGGVLFKQLYLTVLTSVWQQLVEKQVQTVQQRKNIGLETRFCFLLFF